MPLGCDICENIDRILKLSYILVVHFHAGNGVKVVCTHDDSFEDNILSHHHNTAKELACDSGKEFFEGEY